jgi:predicted component of type VI protein secretion system
VPAAPPRAAPLPPDPGPPRDPAPIPPPAPAPVPARDPPTMIAPASRARAAAPPIAPVTARPAAAPGDAQALWQAFLRGAGLDPGSAPAADEARLEQLGRVVRQVAAGLVAQLQQRLIDRFDQRAGGTQFVSGRRNPLDFARDADEVVRLLLSTEPWPGLLDPVQAVGDAQRGLWLEQRAVIPAVHETLRILLGEIDHEPEAATEGPAGWGPWREARRWRQHVAQRQALLDGLEAAFATHFGPALRRALQDPDVARGEAPDVLR